MLNLKSNRMHTRVRLGVHRELNSVEMFLPAVLPAPSLYPRLYIHGACYGLDVMTGSRPGEPVLAVYPDPDGRVVQVYSPDEGRLEFRMSYNPECVGPLIEKLVEINRRLRRSEGHKYEFFATSHFRTGRITVLHPEVHSTLDVARRTHGPRPGDRCDAVNAMTS